MAPLGPGREREMTSQIQPGTRALRYALPVPRSLLPVALLLAASSCAGGGNQGSHRFVEDPSVIDLDRLGPSCPRGLLADPERGCVGERVAGNTALRVVHRHTMSPGFRLIELSYALDGRTLYHWLGEPRGSGAAEIPAGQDDPASGRSFPVFEGDIASGEHELSLRAIYRGHGNGIFSYLRGYTFSVASSERFKAKPSRVTSIIVVAYEKGTAITELAERPAVRFSVSSEPD